MKFRRIIASIALLLGLTFVAAPVVAHAAVLDDACKGAASGSAVCKDKNQTTNPVTGANGILVKAGRIVAIITAIIAVFVIMAGGVMYITAGGDSGKITTAKNMIIYALVGLIIISVSGAIITLIVNAIAT